MRVFYVNADHMVFDKETKQQVKVNEDFALLAKDRESLLERCSKESKFLTWKQVKELDGYPMNSDWDCRG